MKKPFRLVLQRGKDISLGARTQRAFCVIVSVFELFVSAKLRLTDSPISGRTSIVPYSTDTVCVLFVSTHDKNEFWTSHATHWSITNRFSKSLLDSV